jgi:hypothetical protein
LIFFTELLHHNTFLVKVVTQFFIGECVHFLVKGDSLSNVNFELTSEFLPVDF